jgi:hypothetical protein
MLHKSVLIYLTCFVIFHVLSGCCNCEPTGTYRIRWTELKMESKSYSLDSGFIQFRANPGNDYSASNYLLQVKLSSVLLASNSPCTNHFTNSAYACKCDNESTYTSEHAVTSLKVFTLNNYDATHPAQSEVTEYFKTVRDDSTGWPTLQPLDLWLPVGTLAGPARYPPELDYNLFLATRPAPGSLHQFRVDVKLANDSTLSAVTQQIRF